MANSSYSKKGSSAKKSTSTKAKSRSKSSDQQMKLEIANEFGVNLGADATARQNGKVGGEITKRLVKLAQTNLESSNNSK